MARSIIVTLSSWWSPLSLLSRSTGGCVAFQSLPYPYHWHSNVRWLKNPSRSFQHKSFPVGFRRTMSAPTTAPATSEIPADPSCRVDQLLHGKVQIPLHDALQVHGHEKVAFVDGTWWMPNDPRHATLRSTFEAGPRIQGAWMMDIDDVAANEMENPTKLPHMLPTIRAFEVFMDAMNMSPDHHIIVYGQAGCPFYHRAFYQLACCGHDVKRVHVLKASLLAWQASGGPIETQPVIVPRIADLLMAVGDGPTQYRSLISHPRFVVDMAQMKDLVQTNIDIDRITKPSLTNNTIIVDARSPDRFYGRVSEPRPGLRVGHMPGSINLFFQDLLDMSAATGDDKTVALKSKEQLREIIPTIIQQALDQPNSKLKIIATCGSGGTACTITAALLELGMNPNQLSIYDGSWSEWGAYDDTPITTEAK